MHHLFHLGLGGFCLVGWFCLFFLITVFINIITSVTSIVVMFYFVSIIKQFLSKPMSCDGGFFWLVGFARFLIIFFPCSPCHPIVGALGRK